MGQGAAEADITKMMNEMGTESDGEVCFLAIVVLVGGDVAATIVLVLVLVLVLVGVGVGVAITLSRPQHPSNTGTVRVACSRFDPGLWKDYSCMMSVSCPRPWQVEFGDFRTWWKRKETKISSLPKAPPDFMRTVVCVACCLRLCLRLRLRLVLRLVHCLL